MWQSIYVMCMHTPKSIRAVLDSNFALQWIWKKKIHKIWLMSSINLMSLTKILHSLFRIYRQFYTILLHRLKIEQVNIIINTGIFQILGSNIFVKPLDMMLRSTLKSHLDHFISNPLWYCTEEKWQKLCQCSNTFGVDFMYILPNRSCQFWTESWGSDPSLKPSHERKSTACRHSSLHYLVWAGHGQTWDLRDMNIKEKI